MIQGFYNPLSDRFIEPTLPGISYSFTADGHYEQAYYRAIANPTNPQCASAMLQFQHGVYQIVPPNDPALPPLPPDQTPFVGPAIILTPIGVDGRQLTSNPCGGGGKSVYLRYNQTEYMRGYAVGIDPYHKAKRLDLFGYDGTPLNVMYLAYSPPQMLPTQTMNPTAKVTTSARAQQTGSSNVKRSLSGEELMGNVMQAEFLMNEGQKTTWQNVKCHGQKLLTKEGLMNPDHWWWAGVTMTALGALGYYCF